ncbi:MAG TPA: hypothetical protein VLK58_07255 [Conexibacter sp.]|nr:hypothetical protein [Conexibacter sp.]
MGVLGDVWLNISIVLTALAGGILLGLVLPLQERTLRELDGGDQPPDSARLAMTAGLFNILWATVTVLMIVRPGSTTGA